ncbi:AraC family transcriptional regulator [Ralstonia sp. ASV6]|uniref:AraC family transcriptional regulator n=1 Tax=Ralstonia sp. ASV6 TaxID=2795124 RepID=UPI0018EBCD62|nr:AraC family transcriptional regulator [Ralstonia sp. ASV6]
MTSTNTPPPWTHIDPLGEALHFLRMSGVFYCRSEFSAPWGLALPPMPDCMMLHVVASGRAWLEVDGEPARALAPGDLAIVPRGTGHRLTSQPGVACAGLFELPRELMSERYEVLRHGGNGEPAQMICAAVRFGHPAAQRLAAVLPAALCIDSRQSPHAQWIEQTLRFMAAEARMPQPGGETMVTRLADILVILAIRDWIERDPAARSGWVGALQDKQIGRAMALIHREPAREWTLGALANEAAMSRSAFAARFTRLVGEPAMQYVARWRMQIALGWLQEERLPLAEAASRLGYQSEAAFSRAFKRFNGVTPGAARRSATPEATA